MFLFALLEYSARDCTKVCSIGAQSLALHSLQLNTKYVAFTRTGNRAGQPSQCRPVCLYTGSRAPARHLLVPQLYGADNIFIVLINLQERYLIVGRFLFTSPLTRDEDLLPYGLSLKARTACYLLCGRDGDAYRLYLRGGW
ncbi:hypothetical protein EVAR_84833_1 [Eumeta japonica]|uniref:Uncharacterized protein n=1 Tax=Eumeta variegata TaxID=151549 RepID=A0A4C1U846_EUMVA|nr:hypothetical protein EVAR_84833_1 [Eumeta japonica]